MMNTPASAATRLPVVARFGLVTLLIGLVAVGCPISVAGGAGEAPLPSAERGQRLTTTLCIACHVGENGGNTASAVAGIPTLRQIATKPGQSAERIRAALIAPHAPMPDMQISLPEIDDILAYLDTLRPEGAKPLLEPRGEGKKYPAPA